MTYAHNQWSATIQETPLSQHAQPGATVTSFAVANLASAPQAVIVNIFDSSGKLVASAKTPVLTAATSQGPVFEDAATVGGVYPAPLSSLLGIDLVPALGEKVFRGTVTFVGEAGGKIAPLILQMNGPAILSVPVSPR